MRPALRPAPEKCAATGMGRKHQRADAGPVLGLVNRSCFPQLSVALSAGFRAGAASPISAAREHHSIPAQLIPCRLRRLLKYTH